MKSLLFYEGHHEKIAEELKKYLNNVPDFLSDQTASSTRAVGDAIQNIIAEKFGEILGDWCSEYSSTFARRAMADVAFNDSSGLYNVVDVKTHRSDTNFNMPNLTSVERLSRFYEDDNNIFSLLLIRYTLEGNRLVVTNVHFSPIEFLSWKCLTIGALGWGQIQIANSNNIIINDKYSRKQWMLSLCETMLEFYPKEILKIEERIKRFINIKNQWQEKEDIWI